MSPARKVAFEVLRAVEDGSYAADLLLARSAALSPRDAALASEIVFGVLRYQGQLDFLIKQYSGRGAARLDPEVTVVLRMAIYQLRYLTRVPAHAAVNEAVDLVKRAHKRSAGGFVNAVLRRVDREEVKFPDRATELSHPAWLLERWDRQFGPEAAEALAGANLRQPEMYVRVPPGESPPEGAEPTGLPGCWRVAGGNPGNFRIQDIGSQSIVPLLGLAPGHTFLDLCAAPGNKTAQALETGVRAVACDIHPRRAALLKGLGADVVVLDGSRALPFGQRFARILLDAPCSGTGTLARNPEIKWRLKPEDIAGLRQLQTALLAQARAVLAPGGVMVYSTCSLEPEENEEVVATVPPRLVKSTVRRLPGRDPGDGFFAAVIESE